jgi:hypothetical protein
MLHLKKLRQQNALRYAVAIAAMLLLFSMGAFAQMSPKPAPVDTVIKNGTIGHGSAERCRDRCHWKIRDARHHRFAFAQRARQ